MADKTRHSTVLTKFTFIHNSLSLIIDENELMCQCVTGMYVHDAGTHSTFDDIQYSSSATPR